LTMDLVSASNPIAEYGGPTTYNWLNQVPRERLLTHAQACVYYGYALGFTSRFEAQRAFLDTYEKSAAYDPALAGQIALVRTHAAAHQQDPKVEEYAKQHTIRFVSMAPVVFRKCWRTVPACFPGSQISVKMRGRSNGTKPHHTSCGLFQEGGRHVVWRVVPL